ncbi:Radical SAM domain protein [Desulfotomaculum nigrificans CO-1-SRB]|uniref:Radical SAM domain protein n=1 Tax=Desulfotomaculum nigrificans (strain DSM 14880 / VKM B-2319 / CO-1-SRB) TaxID=868595 RepID=F6B6P5_DESCC|nr:radical SAM (seleno)protein TrsS [Desulfotomaculum nigrificans]AEF94419.1 Radical SAM domain protein [Desulfotomaculum nigrificans CO-1-SRB]
MKEQDKFLNDTESLCPHCLSRVPAAKVLRGENVYMIKNCPVHGSFETVLWKGTPDYITWNRPKIPSQPKTCFTEISKGCPFDCGLCPDHRQHSCTVLLEVTQRCNLGCSFCFADAGINSSADPGMQTIESWFKTILATGGPYNIQISGGEPTLRDDLPEIISLGRSLGFQFIQLNTNGLRLAEDPNFVQKLKDSGLSSVFLQFDGTDDDIYLALRGRALLEKKLAAIQQCTEKNIGVVLVPTLVPGVNVNNIGSIIKLAVSYLPHVRGVHFQPVSYFGRYPEQPKDDSRITIPEVIQEIERQSNGQIKAESFKPPGCENSLCSFHGNFVRLPDGTLQPWTKREGCCSKPEKAAEGAAKARNFVAKYWSAPLILKPNTSYNESNYSIFDTFLEQVRTSSFSISGMAFQDAWNLDLERLRDCCIHVVSQEGKLIPFCAYNLTDSKGRPLYRQRRSQYGNDSPAKLDRP